MDELIKRISSYNIFNYLLPGGIFIFLAKKMNISQFSFSSIIEEVVGIYFIGLIISRIGSLIIEPFFKKIKFLTFIDYKKFIKASNTDLKIEILSEVNNMYRTLVSTLSIIILYLAYKKIKSCLSLSAPYEEQLIIIITFVILIFSYRKQTAYIYKRVEAQNKEIISG